MYLLIPIILTKYVPAASFLTRLPGTNPHNCKLQQYIVEHLLDFVFEEVVKSAIMGGRISLKEVPAGFYENPSKFLKHEFIGQGLPWIDPYKEALANKIMLETGQSNLKEIYAKKGKDYEGEIDQIIIEYALKKMAGLIEEPQKGDGKNAQTND